MKGIYFTILFCHVLLPSSAQISFISENFYWQVSSEVNGVLVKQGFDVNFYTPLIDQLNGAVSSCVIEEYLPPEEIQKIMNIERQQKEYETKKAAYQAQKKRYRKKNPFRVLETFDYSGYDITSFAYEMDSAGQSTSISFLQVALMNLTERETRWALSLYQIRQGSAIHPVVFYQAPTWEEQKTNSVFISYLDQEKYEGYQKMRVLYQKLETDTLLDYRLNVLGSEKDWFAGTMEELNQPPAEIRRTYSTDSSVTDYGFYLKENDTIPLFSKTFNPKGLLTQQIFHTRFFYKAEKNRVENLEKMDYKYDEKGLPFKVIYQKGNDLPVEYFLKFSTPDQFGNFTKMEIQNNENVSISEIYWYINYRF